MMGLLRDYYTCHAEGFRSCLEGFINSLSIASPKLRQWIRTHPFYPSPKPPHPMAPDDVSVRYNRGDNDTKFSRQPKDKKAS